MQAALLKVIRSTEIQSSAEDTAFLSLGMPVADLHAPHRLVQPGERVVHLGAGTGLATVALGYAAGAEGEVLGIEPDWSLYARGRENLALTGQNQVRLHHGPLHKTPGIDGAYDLVICNAIWAECPEPMWVMDEAARLLRVGGRLALRDWISTGTAAFNLNAPPTAAQLRAMLVEAGFVDIHIQLDGSRQEADPGPGLAAVTVDAGRR
jgi:ubiquinone/menaquinone biosynthesis C-methylase UbiE